jgi:TonB family protein
MEYSCERVLPTPSTALRAVLLGASAAVHGLVLMAVGHSPAPAGDVALEIAVAIDRPTAASLDTATPEPASGAPALAAPRTHTHPYPVPPDHDAHPHDPSLVHLPVPLPHAPSVPTPAAPAPEVIDAPASAPAPRFVMVVGGGDASHHPSPATAAAAAPPGMDGPLPEAYVSTPARSLTPILGVYPPAARASEVEADVVLQIVVTSTGAVADAQVMQHAGYGFDEAALRAIRGARFSPAQRDGHAVAVRMRWTVSFRLR